MSNNTSKYQEYTFKELLDQYDKILVPMIQRDYAQGRTDKKATDVRNNLLTDIFSDKNVHFDLVFGSKEKRIIDGKEMNCFIPVDGQQRLTTLFLLHLYGQKEGKTNTDLNLSKFSYDTRRAASDFCKSITSEEWVVPNDKNVSDVIKDSSWFMNYWEKDPTVEGMLNMLDAIQEKCKEKTDYPSLDKVTFFFFDLESNGLNENLYLKMNSRGKPLTAFENLKAKMEKVLPEKIEIEDKYFPKCDASPKDSFKAKWKYFMDRNWTETFWDKEHPEKYDESITKFIVRFLSGYWVAYGDKDEEQEQKFADEIKSLNSKDSYADFIPFEPIKKVLDLEKAFSALAYAMTTVPKIEPYWTNDTIKVSDQSEYKFLAVVFTYVLFDGDKDAMRFAWNMSENYVTGYDTFAAYCKRAKEIHDKFEPNEDNAFYKILSGNGIANPSDQFKEEIAKAKQILDENGELRKYEGIHKKEDGSIQTWEGIIIKAEQFAFFKGTIRFLFQDGNGEVDVDPIAGTWNTNHFDTKWMNAQMYFDENGVKKEYQAQSILLRTFISKFKNWDDFWGFNYDNEISTWRYLLTSKRYFPLNEILSNLIQLENDFASYSASLEDFDKEYKQLQESVQNDLVKTNIVEAFSSAKNAKLNWRYDKYCLYPANTKSPKNICVIADKRNTILSVLIGNNTIECIQTINNCDFFWGWDINFKYNNHCFQWWRNPNDTELDVYLMKENWVYCEKKMHTSDKNTDEDNYFCFRVTEEMGTGDFLKKLDCLIRQACAEEAGKDCFNDCPNEMKNHLS